MRVILALLILLGGVPFAHAGWDHGGPHWHGGWHGGWHHDDGSGFLGGIVGGIIGGILTAPPPPPPPPPPVQEAPLEPWSPEWYDWCGNKYRTFDPKTGYYQGFDGDRHFCTGRN